MFSEHQAYSGCGFSYISSEPHGDVSCGMKSCWFLAPGSGRPQGQSLYLICHCSPLGTGVGVRLTGGMVWSKGSPAGGFLDYMATKDQQPPLRVSSAPRGTDLTLPYHLCGKTLSLETGQRWHWQGWKCCGGPIISYENK